MGGQAWCWWEERGRGSQCPEVSSPAPLRPLPRPPRSRTEPCGWGALSGGASFTSAPGSLLPIPTWPCPQFDPELVLVSAGFDSAIGDPEVKACPGWGGLLGPWGQAPHTWLWFQGQMQATPECFAHLTQLLQLLAGGRVCAVLEVTGGREGSRARCRGAVRGACSTGWGAPLH